MAKSVFGICFKRFLQLHNKTIDKIMPSSGAASTAPQYPKSLYINAIGAQTRTDSTAPDSNSFKSQTTMAVRASKANPKK
jgi:hypothetical protein